MGEPLLIQGGMGVGVSNWCLAKTVASMGQLGVVSGTALDVVLSRRLQLGDSGGHIRRILKSFPVPSIAEAIVKKYFISGGKKPDQSFRGIPMYTLDNCDEQQKLSMVANFVEVALAKESRKGFIGLNLLEKIQLPTLSSLYGALLANVDHVLMGAGIPREIPGALDQLAENKPATLKINVVGAKSDESFLSRFDPKRFLPILHRRLRRPKFLAIISSVVLAMTLAKKATGTVDGFIVENDTAGGHNAPPRGPLQLDNNGEPIYGERDKVDLKKIKALGKPFWLAGGFGSPDGLKKALEQGAAGIQVGTPFAFCNESGFSADIKHEVLRRSHESEGSVRTDPLASASGFPFKIFDAPETLSENVVSEARKRLCDLGFLRHLYKTEDGRVGYRCPAEPVSVYVKKGGDSKETKGRLCLCNGLMGAIGLEQRQRDGYVEPALITAGDAVKSLKVFCSKNNLKYSAEDVVRYILRDHPEAIAQ